MFGQQKNPYLQMQNQADIESSNKVELIVLIYDRIIFNINEAIKGIEQNNIEAKIKHVNKSLQIIELGLVAYLDMSQGDIANNLKNFYTSSMLVLMKSNLENKSQDLYKIVDNFKEMKSAWTKIA